ncbi:MAG: hypothetical protein H8D42_03615 [Candidatus Marinimicrobia bacterium]|nr:hypothetical protein [Candidatus Neomarinimicrobiota bacterium]
MKAIIHFGKANLLETNYDASLIGINYSIVDSDLLGKPEEKSETKHYKILVYISRTLESMWMHYDENIDMKKVLYEYGKRHIVKKLKENTLANVETLWLMTNTHPNQCPFDSSRISEPNGEDIEIEIGMEELMRDNSLIVIATSIIENRDYINSISKEYFGDILFVLKAERDILQLFKESNSEEEFVYRLSSLKNLATNINLKLLREITGIQDKEKKSISLLEELLKPFDGYDDKIILVLRNINRLRQCYPIHGDDVKGVKESLSFFSLDYPISDYEEAWKKILVSYSDILKKIFDIIVRKENT